MNASRILSYVLVAVAAGAGGYLIGHNGGNPSPGGNRVKPGNGGVESRPAPGGTIPLSIAKIVGAEPVTAANANGIMFRALAESDPVNRMASVGLLLEMMTPENAPAIYQAFLDITTKTARRHDGEWGLMLKRYGEVMGAACFKQLLPEPKNLALAIEGWAAVDPEGVLNAIKEARVHDSRFDNAWLTGVCRKDPEKALLLALTGGYTVIDGPALITQAIHTSGLDGAQDALQKALDAPAAEDIAGSAAFQGLFDALADSMFHKNWTEGSPAPMLKWLEEQRGQPYVTPAILERAAHDALIKGDPAAAAAWMERMNEGNEGEAEGARGIFLAIFEQPGILTKVDDATFEQLLPLLPKSGESLRAMASMLAPTNPARAAQLRAAAPQESPPVTVQP